MNFGVVNCLRPLQAARGLIIALVVFVTLMPVQSRADVTEMAVRIDEATLLRLDRESAEIIVGNPVIADITVQSSKMLVVTGKSFGLTNVIVLDAKGEEIVNAKVTVRTDERRVVTLRKGTARFSYHCAPKCQETLLIGDYAPQFDKIQKSTAAKFAIVNSSIAGGPAPQ
ncbi:MAG: pilus assembly protein N-terminal domain-containing protein [Methyloligellaceae bacterium]